MAWRALQGGGWVSDDGEYSDTDPELDTATASAPTGAPDEDSTAMPEDAPPPAPAAPAAQAAAAPRPDPFEDVIPGIESDHGRNMNHPRITDRNSKHYGDRAGGKWALMPRTVRDLLSTHHDLGQKYGALFTGKTNDEISDTLAANQDVDRDLAANLWHEAIDRHHGSARDAAADWISGPDGVAVWHDYLENGGRGLKDSQIARAKKIDSYVKDFDARYAGGAGGGAYDYLKKGAGGSGGAGGASPRAPDASNVMPDGFSPVYDPSAEPSTAPIFDPSKYSREDLISSLPAGGSPTPSPLPSPPSASTPGVGVGAVQMDHSDTAGGGGMTAMQDASGKPVAYADTSGKVVNAPKMATPIARPPDGGAGQGGNAAAAAVAPPRDPLETQFDDIQRELTAQRLADKTWNAQREQMLDGLRADALSGKIDPDHFYASRGSAARIMAAVADALGAVGSGLAHTPNFAHETIQAAINADIEAQKAQMGQKMNAYSIAVQQTGSERAARTSTNALLWDQARLLMAELRNQGKGREALDKKAVIAAQQNAQGGAIIKDVARSYDKLIGKGTLNSIYAWITKKFPDNPISEPNSKVYGDTVASSTEMFMKTIPGIRHTPENVERVKTLFPVAGGESGRNAAKLESLAQALKDGTLYQHLQENGVDLLAPGEKETIDPKTGYAVGGSAPKNGDASLPDAYDTEEADTGE